VTTILPLACMSSTFLDATDEWNCTMFAIAEPRGHLCGQWKALQPGLFHLTLLFRGSFVLL
jgi:hypothetical protein